MSDHAGFMDRPTRAQRFEGRLARALSHIPGRWLLRLIRETPCVLHGQTLDPHVQFILAARRRKPSVLICGPTPPEARARYRCDVRAVTTGAGVPPTAVSLVRDLTIDGADGPLRARHYAPRTDTNTPRPLMVYFHGGGFVVGDLETHDEPCRLLCHHADVHVLSVEYRLAPESPFPAAVDDSVAAVRWAQRHAGELGADPERICTGGDSAGANLAAVAALAAAREGRPLAAQLLLYPTTDSRGTTASKAAFSTGFMLTSGDMNAFTAHYFSGDLSLQADPRVSPALDSDLALSPPTLILTAAFDPLRDEGEAYAELLRATGVTVHCARADGMVHGFVHMTTVVPTALSAYITMARQFRSLVNQPVSAVVQPR